MRPLIVMVCLLSAGRAMANEASELADNLRLARAEAKLHDSSAAAHDKLAELLLKASAGEAARAEAQRAVEAEPLSAEAWRKLAFVAQHDVVGHFHGHAFDFGGAVAAYERAISLDASNPVLRHELAQLIVEGAPSAGLTSVAVSTLVHLREQLQDHSDDLLLVRLLFLQGRQREAEHLAETQDQSAELQAVVLAQHARRVGGKLALKRLEKQVPDIASRRRIAELAGTQLFRERRYPEAAPLLAAAATDAKVKQAAAQLALLRRHESFSFPTRDPSAAVFSLLSSVFGGDGDGLFDAEVAAADIEAMRARVRAAINQAGEPMHVLDLLFSHRNVVSEGSDRLGYWITVNRTDDLPGLQPLFIRVVHKASSGYSVRDVQLAGPPLRGRILAAESFRALFREPSALPKALSDAREVVKATSEPDALRDAAAVLVEGGLFSEAQAAMWRSLALRDQAPTPSDWYVFGRLYEQVGLLEDATQAYLRVGPADPANPFSSTVLARKRLDAMKPR